MDPTTIIVTAAITALVTTVVAEFIKIGIRALGRRWGKRHVPAMLARRDGWVLVNQSKTVMLGVSLYITHSQEDGVAQRAPEVRQLGSINPKGQAYVQPGIRSGDWVRVSWTVYKRRERYFQATVQIRDDVNDYPLSTEDIIGPGGM